ncbi:MAG: hypothetical protein DMF82_08055 [Acidobacteria bacterium]|nr:MAG: hypothetical protein DMF82_08055 [Acidobacteriota bacterium]
MDGEPERVLVDVEGEEVAPLEVQDVHVGHGIQPVPSIGDAAVAVDGAPLQVERPDGGVRDPVAAGDTQRVRDPLLGLLRRSQLLVEPEIHPRLRRAAVAVVAGFFLIVRGQPSAPDRGVGDERMSDDGKDSLRSGQR